MSPQVIFSVIMAVILYFIFSPSSEDRQERMDNYCQSVSIYSQTGGEQGEPDYKGLRSYCRGNKYVE